MKKTLLFSVLLIASKALFAQWVYAPGNTNMIYNTPTGAAVGIGLTNPAFTLDVNGTFHTTQLSLAESSIPNGITQWIRGTANCSGNLVLQGNVSSSSAGPAFWISGSSGFLKIGAIGGSEPAV